MHVADRQVDLEEARHSLNECLYQALFCGSEKRLATMEPRKQKRLEGRPTSHSVFVVSKEKLLFYQFLFQLLNLPLDQL